MTSSAGVVAVNGFLGLLGPTSKGRSGLDHREWNTTVGVVTSIVGNVLISFALNIQRYAHIRLSRQQYRSRQSSNLGKLRQNGKNYGTQIRIAEERAELNLNAPFEDEHDPSHRERYHGEDGSGETPGADELAEPRSSSEYTVKQEKVANGSEQSTNYLKSPYWWIGILLMTIGEAGNFLAYGFAPASIVSPLGVVALVSNCIIAPCLLKERFRWRDFAGVVVAVGGAVTVVLSAKTSETRMGPDDVWHAITRWEFEVYLGVTAGLIGVLMWASGKYGDKTLLVDLGLVGLFGGYTALSTKGVASMLSNTLWRALTFPITYLLVLVLVSTALLQIRYINRALQRFDSTQVIPTQFVMFTISVIIGSAVLYRDFESATAERVGKFVGGCALTFLGVWLITSGRATNGNEYGEEQSIDEEEGIDLLDEESRHGDLDGTPAKEGDSRRRSEVSPAVHDGAMENNSRRPSHQQANGRQADPQTPRRYHSHTSSTGSRPFTPPTPGLGSPLLDNPWLSFPERLNHRATSTPAILPSTGDLPLAESSSRPPDFESPSRERPSSISRRSLSRIMPGPLMSPLSSSLTVVAESLRRGINSPVRLQRRRRGSILQSSGSQRFYDHAAGTGNSLPPSPVRAPLDRSVGSEEASASSKARSRSFGGFFHLSRAGSSAAPGEDGDTGPDPSPSK